MYIEAETEGRNLSLTAHEHFISNLKTPCQDFHVSYRKHDTPSSLLLKVMHACEVATSVPCWLRANGNKHLTLYIRLEDLRFTSRIR